MKTYKINKTFKNQSECDKWENENLQDRMYNGEFIFMVCHDAVCGSDEVELTEIWTC